MSSRSNLSEAWAVSSLTSGAARHLERTGIDWETCGHIGQAMASVEVAPQDTSSGEDRIPPNEFCFGAGPKSGLKVIITLSIFWFRG